MLVVLVGVPGSGKSTYAHANFRHVVSPDAIRLERFGVRFDRTIEGAVWKDAYARVASHLDRGEVVCFDATSVTRKRRRKLLSLARDAGAPAVAIWLRIDTETAWTRNKQREHAVPRRAFAQLVRALLPPETEEGFAAVRTIDVD